MSLFDFKPEYLKSLHLLSAITIIIGLNGGLPQSVILYYPFWKKNSQYFIVPCLCLHFYFKHHLENSWLYPIRREQFLYSIITITRWTSSKCLHRKMFNNKYTKFTYTYAGTLNPWLTWDKYVLRKPSIDDKKKFFVDKEKYSTRERGRDDAHKDDVKGYKRASKTKRKLWFISFYIHNYHQNTKQIIFILFKSQTFKKIVVRRSTQKLIPSLIRSQNSHLAVSLLSSSQHFLIYAAGSYVSDIFTYCYHLSYIYLIGLWILFSKTFNTAVISFPVCNSLSESISNPLVNQSIFPVRIWISSIFRSLMNWLLNLCLYNLLIFGQLSTTVNNNSSLHHYIFRFQSNYQKNSRWNCVHNSMLYIHYIISSLLVLLLLILHIESNHKLFLDSLIAIVTIYVRRLNIAYIIFHLRQWWTK